MKGPSADFLNTCVYPCKTQHIYSMRPKPSCQQCSPEKPWAPVEPWEIFLPVLFFLPSASSRVSFNTTQCCFLLITSLYFTLITALRQTNAFKFTLHQQPFKAAAKRTAVIRQLLIEINFHPPTELQHFHQAQLEMEWSCFFHHTSDTHLHTHTQICWLALQGRL